MVVPHLLLDSMRLLFRNSEYKADTLLPWTEIDRQDDFGFFRVNPLQRIRYLLNGIQLGLRICENA